MKLKEYWQSKSLSQRIRLCIIIVLMITFAFFLIKGNFFDNKDIPPETSQSDSSVVSSELETDEDTAVGFFQSGWVDIAILITLIIVYGIIKYIKTRKWR